MKRIGRFPKYSDNAQDAGILDHAFYPYTMPLTVGDYTRRAPPCGVTRTVLICTDIKDYLATIHQI